MTARVSAKCGLVWLAMVGCMDQVDEGAGTAPGDHLGAEAHDQTGPPCLPAHHPLSPAFIRPHPRPRTGPRALLPHHPLPPSFTRPPPPRSRATSAAVCSTPSPTSPTPD